jgi:hypothetical protein
MLVDFPIHFEAVPAHKAEQENANNRQNYFAKSARIQ